MIRALSICTFLSCLVISVSVAVAAESNQVLIGINLPTAAYNGKALPGRHGYDYLWPDQAEIKRFAGVGFSVMRIAFLWERMQPELNGPLSDSELANLDKIISAAIDSKVTIVIDPHNFGLYRGNVIGRESVSNQNFYDFWYKLANRYKSSPNVIFGLMNEPNKQSTTEWAQSAQIGVNAIRKAGATQLILVPGTKWSAAHSWTASSLTAPSNGEVLIKISDPLKNIAYEMHGYLDVDSSGTHTECVSEDIGSKRFKDATAWLRQNHVKGFVGEMGIANNPTCLAAMDNFLNFLVQNSDVWMGFTYWSASKWGGRYVYDINTLDSEKQPQFGVIKKYLHH
jgi:endoglucanase